MSPRPLYRHSTPRPILLAAALAWAAVPALRAAPPAPVAEAPQAMDTLAARLQDAGSAERYAFARLALEELIAAYAGELQRAESEAAAAGADLQRWRRSTARYLAHLETLRRRLEQGAPVAVHLGPDGILQLRVDRGLLLLTGPWVDRPHALQQTVLHRYCRVHACGDEDAEHLAPSPVADGDGAVWSFAEGRGVALITSDGLEFPFDDVQSRSAKRALAETLARELRDLARLLEGLPGPARRLAAGPGDRVRVGDHGASLSAPTLRRAPWLWPNTLRWAEARARGRAQRVVLPGLERLLPAGSDLAWSGTHRPSP